MRISKVAFAVLSCLIVMHWCVSPVVAAAPNVTFTATGTFAATPTTGADKFKLANEPFSISVVANAAAVPIKHGPNWALFSPLHMTGTVHSGLLGPTPVTIASQAASIEQVIGPQFDEIVVGMPVKVVGISLTIRATVFAPPGTIPNQLIHIFNPVALSPGMATVVYSDGVDQTTIAIASGTLSAAIAGAASHAVRLH